MERLREKTGRITAAIFSPRNLEVVGLFLIAEGMGDITATSNSIVISEVNKVFPPVTVAETDRAKAEKASFYARLDESIAAGGTVIDIASITDPESLRQAYETLGIASRRSEYELYLGRQRSLYTGHEEQFQRPFTIFLAGLGSLGLGILLQVGNHIRSRRATQAA